MFFFQFLVQAGLFFTIPLYLSVALGLSAIDTGMKIMPLSITLLIAAAGIPRFFPNISPRLVVRIGLLAMFAGIVSLFMNIDVHAGAEIVTVPLLFAGLGIGALASQLGQRDGLRRPRRPEPGGRRAPEHGHEPGGLDRDGPRRFLVDRGAHGFVPERDRAEPRGPDRGGAQANVELAGGIPFISDADLDAALTQAGVDPAVSQAVLDENEQARLDGLRTALAALALIALIGLFFSGRIRGSSPARHRVRQRARRSAGSHETAGHGRWLPYARARGTMCAREEGGGPACMNSVRPSR